VKGRGPDRGCVCNQCKTKGWTPKNGRSIRSFRIPPKPEELRKAILRYLADHPAKEGEFVFRNPRTGACWNTRSLISDFKGLCERAGVLYGRDIEGGITLHTLRHTCATNLVRSGVRESIIADLLGDSVQTVAEVYVNLNHDDLADGISAGPEFAP